MSSKSLVLTLFVLWSALCCYRYVCGIKQVCGNNRPTQAQQAIPFQPETLNNEDAGFDQTSTENQSAITPIKDTLTSATPAPSPTPPSDPDISKVQVEELADRVRIHFPYNSTRKVDDAAIDEYLSRLAQQLTSGGGKVTLTGHTDNVGDTQTNYAFALRRAKNIRDILIKKGVAKSQITCKSFGEKEPIASNDNPKGRFQNRRVEIRVR